MEQKLFAELKKATYRIETVPHTVIAVSIENAELISTSRVAYSCKRAKGGIEFVLNLISCNVLKLVMMKF